MGGHGGRVECLKYVDIGRSEYQNQSAPGFSLTVVAVETGRKYMLNLTEIGHNVRTTVLWDCIDLGEESQPESVGYSTMVA